LPYGEQFLAKDRKVRYIQPIRIKMQKFMWNKLKNINADIPVYMCMESSTAWKSINVVLNILKKLTGSKNEREIKKLWPLVKKINDFEAEVKKLDNPALQNKTKQFLEKVFM